MSLALARGFAAALTASGVRTVTDPRNVVTPCVLLTPPVRTYDLHNGYTATWQAYVLAGDSGSESTWEALDDLTDQLAALVDVETVTPTAWRASADAVPIPAALATFSSPVQVES